MLLDWSQGIPSHLLFQGRGREGQKSMGGIVGLTKHYPNLIMIGQRQTEPKPTLCSLDTGGLRPDRGEGQPSLNTV